MAPACSSPLNQFAQARTGIIGIGIGIVCHVTDTLAAHGEVLRHGQSIICGSITPPRWVDPGEEIAYEQAPVGIVSAYLLL